MTNKTPSEILEMEKIEREFTVSLAVELERWRWKQWSEIFGG